MSVNKILSFEDKLKQLSKNVNHNDILRNIETGLPESIESFLTVNELAVYFGPHGYEINNKSDVLDKLYKIRKLLDNHLVPTSSAESLAVDICIYYVKEGWTLTTDVMIFLNKIYKSYK